MCPLPQKIKKMSSLRIKLLTLGGLLIIATIGLSSAAAVSSESKYGDLPEESSLSSSASVEDDFFPGNYVLPKQIFNEGKPFYLDKDPVSGQLDFSSKKPAGIEPEVNEVIDQKEKNLVLNSVQPNFHDFLNLPVKYSSSKFVYPLVSSSYANLKYQGNNKNFMSNHKNVSTATMGSSFYVTSHKSNVGKIGGEVTPKPSLAIVTSSKPLGFEFDDKVTKQKFSPTKKITPTTTQRTTTAVKLAPTTKLPPILTSVIPLTTTARSTTRLPATSSTTTTTTTTTTKRPTTTTTFRPSPPTAFTSTTPQFFPTVVTQAPVARPNSPVSIMNPADVYNTVGQKKDPNSMSLAEIFNSLSEEDMSYASGEQGFTSQGDLMQPILPSQPAPFSLRKPEAPLKEGPPTAPSFANIPTSTWQPQLLNFGPTSEAPPQVVPQQYANEYVRYEVQQPNMNVMGYGGPVPSMNNVVISPEQSSATFVLGSQQTVGTGQYVGTAVKEQVPVFGNGQRIQYGTVINEAISSVGQPQRPMSVDSSAEHPPNFQQQTFIPNSSEQQTQELYVSSNIRFPSEDFVNEQGSPVNGHSAPVALPHIQMQSVSFPKNDYGDKQPVIKENLNKVVFMAEPRPEENLGQKQEVLTLNQQQLQNKINFPQLPEDLTPPLPPRPPSHHLHNELTRKPHPGPHRLPSDRPLPNILPQFRPNAKVSSGHPAFHKEPGNIRMNHPNGPYHNRPPMPPPFQHRRTPIGHRYKKYPEPMENNRRVYKVPPPSIHGLPPGPPPQIFERMYLKQQHPQQLSQQHPQQLAAHLVNQPPPSRFVENFSSERHVNSPQNVEAFQMPDLEVQPERLPAFEEEDFVVNTPPKSMLNQEPEPNKLEPVVTLQMLQSQKKPLAIPSNQPNTVDVPPPPQTSQQIAPGQSPVYVVYPVKSSPMQMDIGGPLDLDESVVIGQRGEQPPVPPADINSMAATADYQNTPFSVVRDQPQEPILMVRNKPQSQPKANFPYPLEKPDPTFAELSKQHDINRYDQEILNLSPRVVNRGNIYSSDDIDRKTDIPIAIAYTPTEPSPYYAAYHSDGQYSKPNVANAVISEIRGTQTESSFNDESSDSRGQYYEKNFMAPFYPSMSLSGITSAQNGWAVIPSSTEQTVFEKNSINRADTKETQNLEESHESSTKKFESDRFTPDLQGGFKPIYPPDYKTAGSEEDRYSDLSITTATPPSTTTANPFNSTSQAPSTPSPSKTATTISTTTTTSTEKPKRTKSRLEASIESLLFGDDEDFEDDDEPTVSKS